MTDDRLNPVSHVSQGSDEVRSPSEPAFLAIGRVLRPHGIHGELRVEIHTDYPERFAVYRRLYLGPEHAPFHVEGHRFHHNLVLIKLVGVNDRDAADLLRGQWVQIAAADAVPLAEGEVYYHQILAMRVRTDAGEDLGEVTDMIETGANAVYVVSGLQGEILIPDIPDVVLQIDAAARQMTVRLIEGLR
ncbi:MAG: 16S rRNA processing protein RimM [Anaerolineae bacterium]|nr:16S rRNA processing protein RimM [Anaerolineae bacterium]